MPIVFTNSVSPICMPNGRRPYVGDKAIITGWVNLIKRSLRYQLINLRII